MGFLNSIWLWSGLAAAGVAVPIIIHLLNRYRHRTVDWAAMELLKKALTLRSRQMRLEDLILLILRCAAILLIALALARPTLRGSTAKLFGGDQQASVLIALDGSFSMAQRDTTSRFDRAKDRVREIARTLKSGDSVSLILMGGRPRVLLRNVPYDQRQFAKTIDELNVLNERLNGDTCLGEAESVLGDMKASSRECYIVSDGQATTWRGLSEQGRQALANISAGGPLFFIATDGGAGENLALTDFRLLAGQLRRGLPARYVAEVKNFGRSDAHDVTVSLFVNDGPEAVDLKSIQTLPAGKSATVPLVYQCGQAGDVKLAARLGPDSLKLDNARYAVATVRDQVRVLYVDGKLAADSYKIKALAPKTTGAYRTLVVNRINATDLPTRKLSDFDVVILSNVGNIPPDRMREIEAFVAHGGGLMIFVGDNVNSAVFNSQYRMGDDSLAPGELGDLMVAKDTAWGMEAAVGSHPISAAVCPPALPKQFVAAMHFDTFSKLKLGNGARDILRVTGQEWPLLAEKPYGWGKVLLCTTSDEWATQPMFPILMQQVVNYLTTQQYQRPVMVGGRFSVPLPAESTAESATVKRPDGTEASVKVANRVGGPVVEFERADAPGFYEAQGGANATPMVAAVNVDTSESDVSCLEPADLSRALAKDPADPNSPPLAQVVAWDDPNLEQAIRTSRVGREIWWMLLAAALVVLAVESFLARWFSKKATARESVSDAFVRSSSFSLSSSEQAKA